MLKDIINYVTHTDFSYHIGTSDDLGTYEIGDIVVDQADDLTANFSEWSNGATRVVIFDKDYVVKSAFYAKTYGKEDDDFDYLESSMCCKIECEIYEKAYKLGLSNFFAKTKSLDDYSCIQERMDFIMNEKDSKKRTEEQLIDFWKVTPEQCDYLKSKQLDLSDLSIKIFIEQNGIEKVMLLFDFLNKFEINDLCSSNLGYKYGFLKIYDFGTFATNSSRILEVE